MTTVSAAATTTRVTRHFVSNVPETRGARTTTLLWHTPLMISFIASAPWGQANMDSMHRVKDTRLAQSEPSVQGLLTPISPDWCHEAQPPSLSSARAACGHS